MPQVASRADGLLQSPVQEAHGEDSLAPQGVGTGQISTAFCCATGLGSYANNREFKRGITPKSNQNKGENYYE